MAKQIILRNENNERVGIVFPRRAKQLVTQNKAIWTDGTQTELILITRRAEKDLNGKTMEVKTDMSTDIIADKRFDDIPDDFSAAEDLAKSIRSKSIIKDAYRDSVTVVLTSTPVEIIKKSKRRTRELHAAFSLVLWFGAAIIYFGLSRLLGYTEFTLNITELSWTWLIFVLAATIECASEVYFCKRELAVLNENIDLRQINPDKGTGDFDLFDYQKRLTRKVQVMAEAIIWLTAAFAYCCVGYAFGIWVQALVIFVLAIFYKLVQNLLKKLKATE